ncbi:MAG: acetate--CoA ligase family protein, partial [Candidatus Rokubacteria bacterium]|nr:acetate--CoA ligase family protein [Candidatus Rokubacteria bacterium]
GAPWARAPRALPAELAARLAGAEGPLEHAASRAILEHYGVPFAREALVDSVEAALEAGRKLGYPVVLKTAAAVVLHKTEAGGVILDVGGPEALAEACRALASRFGAARVVVQERVGPGVELLVGGRRDPDFGPTLLVGVGGVLTELLREVSLRLAPLGYDDAVAMLREGRKGTLLRGFRAGRRPTSGRSRRWSWRWAPSWPTTRRSWSWT